jgi:outer membrane protein assembly factor BamB
MAINKKTGKTVWKTDRPEFPRGYSTPAIWTVNVKKQIVVCGTLRIVGYDLQTGKEIWTVRGFARIANHTPSIGDDGNLYVSAWAPGGETGEQISVPPYIELLKLNDNNANRALEYEEVKSHSALRNRFRQIDRNKDGRITEAEYESMRRVFDQAQNVIMAIRPGGVGDITESQVTWRYHKMLPYVASPVFYKGHLFMVKKSGIVSSLDATTGQPRKQDRIPARSNVYSSPVAADDKVYLISESGEASVIRAAAQWSVISHTRLGERCYATPALSRGRTFVRTEKTLYCFGALE